MKNRFFSRFFEKKDGKRYKMVKKIKRIEMMIGKINMKMLDSLFGCDCKRMKKKEKDVRWS
jgi:hypothetical protein